MMQMLLHAHWGLERLSKRMNAQQSQFVHKGECLLEILDAQDRVSCLFAGQWGSQESPGLAPIPSYPSRALKVIIPNHRKTVKTPSLQSLMRPSNFDGGDLWETAPHEKLPGIGDCCCEVQNYMSALTT
jgi:hypothetical protein